MRQFTQMTRILYLKEKSGPGLERVKNFDQNSDNLM